MMEVTTGPVQASFNEETLKAYVASEPHLLSLFKGDLSDVSVAEIGDGNLNFVFFVSGNDGALAMKQALPYSRISGGARSLTCERLAFETAALREFSRHAPAHVPAIHHFDPEKSLLVLEFLSPHMVMRRGMIEGVYYPRFPDHISTYLANCLYGTSDFALEPSTKRGMVGYFSRNVELCEITERLIFTEPYTRSANNRWSRPALDDMVRGLQADVELKIRVAALKLKFLTSTDALLHADLHSGSIMLTADDTKVIDPEFAVFGPMGFDIGILTGNLLLSYFAQAAYDTPHDDRSQYRGHILKMIEEIWNQFTRKFQCLWRQGRQGGGYSGAAFSSDDPEMKTALNKVVAGYLDDVLRDSLGYAAVEMIRRTIGRAHTIDFDLIEDEALRIRSEKQVLAFAVAALKNSQHLKRIEDMTDLARRHVGAPAE